MADQPEPRPAVQFRPIGVTLSCAFVTFVAGPLGLLVVGFCLTRGWRRLTPIERTTVIVFSVCALVARMVIFHYFPPLHDAPGID